MKLEGIKNLITELCQATTATRRSSPHMVFLQEILPTTDISGWGNLKHAVQDADFWEENLCPNVFSNDNHCKWIRCCINAFLYSCIYLFLYFLESVFDFILLWFLIGLQLLIHHMKFWQNTILRLFISPIPPWHWRYY